MEYRLNKVDRNVKEKVLKTTDTQKVHKLNTYDVQAYKEKSKDQHGNYKKKDEEVYEVRAVKDDNKIKGNNIDILE